MTLKAHHIYPSAYSFRLDSNDLNQIASDQYRVHTSRFHQKVHDVLAVLWKPTINAGYFAARVIEPLPGQNKGSFLWASANRIYALVLAVGFGLVGLCTLPVLLPLNLWNHSHRQTIQYLRSQNGVPLPKDLHFRTHNIAQGPESFVALTDLRPNKQRASELVDSILKDPKAPRFMVFQEAYNQVDVLVKLKEKYPHIIHSVAPDALGTSSGFFVASQYPIENVEFRRLEMERPEKYIARGALKVRIGTDQGPLDMYTVHLQALLGTDRAARRLEQIQAMKEWMESDYKKDQVPQVFIGDFNTSPISAWGEDNDDPKQPEWKVLEYLRNHFHDCFGEDHDLKTSKRIVGAPLFLAHDNQRIGVNLREPTGSLCHGPFLAKGFALALKMAIDRWRHQYPSAKVLIPPEKGTAWGSSDWKAKQTENPARLDHAMIPKYCRHFFSSMNAEIRRIPIPEGQSDVSDHRPLDVVLSRI